MIILLVIGGIFGLCVAVVLGGGVLLEAEVCAALADQLVVTEQVGDDLECDLDWDSTLDDERLDYFHYDIQGTKGRGVAEVHTEATGPDATEELVDGTLMVGGRRFEL